VVIFSKFEYGLGGPPSLLFNAYGVQPLGDEADNTPLSNVETKGDWSCSSPAPTCHRGPYWDNIVCGCFIVIIIIIVIIKLQVD
jgi:hypothetical protein